MAADMAPMTEPAMSEPTTPAAKTHKGSAFPHALHNWAFATQATHSATTTLAPAARPAYSHPPR